MKHTKHRHRPRRIEESHGRVYEYVRDRTSALGHQLQQRARRTRDWYDDTFDDYPLAIGAAFFTLGLIGGLAMPPSRREHRLLGPTRDRLFDTAQAVGGQLLEKSEEVAERAVESVRSAIGNSGEALGKGKGKRRS